MTDGYLEHPVFLCGHRKGGTTVLLCLFDGHPQLLTFPVDSAFFYEAFPACETIARDETIARIVAKTFRENMVEERALVGDPVVYDVDALVDAFTGHAAAGPHEPATYLRAMIRAYAEHCGQDGRGWRGWVEKTTSTEIYAQQIAEWFPEARFIHLVRDPRDNWGSLKSGWDKRYKNQEASTSALLQTLIDRGGLGLRMAGMNQAALGAERYHVARFEDLAAHPREVLGAMCAFLGVDYTATLETPTVNGRLWRGNNFEGQSFSGLNPVNVGRWAQRIPRHEAAVIEAHLGDVMESLGYDLTFTPAERARAAAEHYKWFNFDGRGSVRS